MSVRGRCWLTGASAVLWLTWLPLAWLGASAEHSSTTLELVAEHAVMLAGVISTLTAVLCWCVTPFIATAKVYMRIGVLEERARQTAACSCQEKKAVGCVVIPIRPVRMDVLSDS